MKKRIISILFFALLLSSCSSIPSSSIEPSSEIPSSSEPSSLEPSSEQPSSETPSSSEKPSSSEPSSSEQPSSSEEPSSYTGYYEDINPTFTGNKLLSQVRELIVTTHTHFASYGDSRGGTSGRSDETDYDPNNKNNLIMFYTHASVKGTWDGGDTYNREHLWCQANTNGLFGQSYGGADMHHIRPCFSGVNSSRGNKKYGEVTNGTVKTYTYSGVTYEAGSYNSAIFEPMDFAKGDVARIILYMFVRYNTIENLNINNLDSSGLMCFTQGKGCGNLPITNIIAGTKTKAFETLLAWHELDPVDELEINRNDGVYNIQGNRNPFIDHPEFVDMIWGNY